ncbi:MAG: indole-3-glycerol-phosphate synthase [Phycisphaerales bacterium JB060]
MTAGTFLQQMAAASRQRASQAASRTPLADMRSCSLDVRPPIPLHLNRFDLIAEVKRTSPSQGKLACESLDILARAHAYADAGAALISVLTEPSRFGGGEDDLRSIARGVDAAVMRKDFLVDPYQVYEARAWGASAVLLIARILDDDALARMLDACENAGLTVLLEAFDAGDLARSARALEGRSDVLLGLNCRDLATLHEDSTRFASLASAFPEGIVRIAESGIATAEDAARVARLGYDGALVGTALMRADDPGVLVRTMIEAGRAARG